MLKFIVDDKIPFIKSVLEAYGKVIYLDGKEITGRELKDADALIIRTRTKVSSTLLKGSAIKFVGTATIGTDHIDLPWCEDSGIYCASAPGCNSESVMQYIAAALSYLQIKNRLNPADTTIGIIGVGSIGAKVESLARLLGYRVLLNDPPREKAEGGKNFTSLDDLAKRSDIITIHVPLNESGEYKTRNLIDQKLLGLFDKKTCLINSSRGEVINEKALLGAMARGNISDLVLDVWQNEPVINRKLLHEASLATPHIAGYSREGKYNATNIILGKLSAFFGLPELKAMPLLPTESDKQIIVKSPQKDITSAVSSVILSTCPLDIDTLMLKDQPGRFESFRTAYINRREFSFHRVKATGTQADMVLDSLGFMLDSKIRKH